MKQTPNFSLCQWDPEDRIQLENFNNDNSKIDTALGKIQAASSYVKLMDLTLETETQKWDIDMSGIDLTQYQKLVLYPHLSGNNVQWVYLHINRLTSGYDSQNNNTKHCGQVPIMNKPDQQNFGICEFTFLIELPYIYVAQLGVRSRTSGNLPSMWGYSCPKLGDGVTRLETLNLWFDNDTSYHLLPGSKVQLYGLKR